MVTQKIIDKLEERRAELIAMLEKNEVKLERQHQIYGAINEIDMFLNTLQWQEEHNTIGPVRLVRPNEEQEGFFSKVFQGLKQKVKRNR